MAGLLGLVRDVGSSTFSFKAAVKLAQFVVSKYTNVIKSNLFLIFDISKTLITTKAPSV